MRKAGRWDYGLVGKVRFIRILLGFVGLCLVLMTLEAPNLFRPRQLQISSQHAEPLKAEVEPDNQKWRRNLDEQEENPFVQAAVQQKSETESGGIRPVANSEADDEENASTDSSQSSSLSSSASASYALLHAAHKARAAGDKMQKLIDSSYASSKNNTRLRNLARNSSASAADGQHSECPQVLMLTADQLRSTNNVMLIPCGLASGSSITLVARPLKAHIEDSPHIRMLPDGQKEVLVSQFMVELRGLKVAHGEDPPRILHVNPRLKGDWSGKPVIELNTCYRGQWGVAQRCEGWVSTEDEEPVDGLPRCENWLREDANSSESSGNGNGGSDSVGRSNPDEKPKSWWLKRWIASPEKGAVDWLYPFAEERLFVLTIRAGWEGYHVSVDGRHITSFPYRTGFVLEEATGFAIAGDVDIRSVVATSLPSSHASQSSEQLLEESEKYKAPPLPKSYPVHLFIGILSASNHFAERMAVRKSWLQSKSIRTSLVVARFFVALHADLEINLQVREEAEYFGDMVILPFIDHYDLVVLKTVAICEYAVRNVSARHIMKTDDDTFVRVEVISNLLKSTRKAPGLYMGNINQFHRPLREGKWAVTYEEWPEEEYPPYANGPGYIISSDIAKFILEQRRNHTLRLFKMEDVSMGMWVVQFNLAQAVHYVHNLKFCQWGCIEDYYTAHYQSPRQMLCMWEKLQQGEAQCCNMR